MCVRIEGANSEQPEWRVVRGASLSYVRAIRAHWPFRERLSCAVRSIRRDAPGIELAMRCCREHADDFVIAWHAGQALTVSADSSVCERATLGAMPHQVNDAVLHADARLSRRLMSQRAQVRARRFPERSIGAVHLP